MGSVKDLARGDSLAGRLYRPMQHHQFGLGCWSVKGTFSVKDLKNVIPQTEIPQKPEALAMMTAAFFEHLAEVCPDIPTTYVGLLDKEGMIVDTATLLARGELSRLFVTQLAYVPETYAKDQGWGTLSSQGQLRLYRQALATGQLQCGVADVESIFRKGFPLGSSTFKKIFAAVGMGKEYESLATYDDVVGGLNTVRVLVEQHGMSRYPKLEGILADAHLDKIPNPGYVLRDITYDSTSKFESAGDRPLTKEEEQRLSGLDEEGYHLWANDYVPRIACAEVAFAQAHRLLNMDGKGEAVAYLRKPWLTDFKCTIDENRLMIVVDEWAVPTNKEIQRALFTKVGVDSAISEAKQRAAAAGSVDTWRNYMQPVCQDRKIDLHAVAEYSCTLMAYAVAEVGNRVLGKEVFDVPPLHRWVGDFMPYASRIEYQEAA